MMTDIHTHILPGVDDGAKNGEESLAMLRLQRESGVERMYLTPHFYPRHQEFEEFLEKRAAARESLRALTVGKDIPEMRLGAEVHYSPDILEMDLRQLTLGDSDFLLLEMPHMIYPAYGEQVVSRILGEGITPILAHVERYLHLQKKGQLKTLIEMGIPMQISAGAFRGPFAAAKASRLMKNGTWFLGTDCHNTSTRPPNYGPAAAYIQKHHPDADAILHWHP